MLTDGRTDGRQTDDGVTGILIAHLGAFGSGELKRAVAFPIRVNNSHAKFGWISSNGLGDRITDRQR